LDGAVVEAGETRMNLARLMAREPLALDLARTMIRGGRSSKILAGDALASLMREASDSATGGAPV
jgi:hypothetical protein